MSAPVADRPRAIRLTVPVSAEAHAAFTRIAKATGMPVGRAMAEWMDDTLDAARYLAETLERAREAPRLVAQQLHAYALGVTDETGHLLRAVNEQARTGATQAPAGALRRGLPPFPPSCNTGGKVPRKGKGKP